MLALVSSPVSWTHYYHLMLLPWSLLLGGVLKGKLGGASRMLFLISVLLSSLPVVDVPEVSPPIREVLARTLISAWLFGGLALLTALIIERRQMGHSKAEGVT